MLLGFPLLLSPACGRDGMGGGDGDGSGGTAVGGNGDGDGDGTGASSPGGELNGTGAQSSGGSGAESSIPDPPDDACARFAFEYDGTDCGDGCESISCECPTSNKNVTACNMVLGCPTALDCDAACDADLADVVSCASSYQPCETNEDCGEGRCVIEAGASSGECTNGDRDDRCRDDDDCIDGVCIAVHSPEEGTRQCAKRLIYDLCNDDDDCSEGYCVVPSDDYQGICRLGELRDLCYATSQCAGDAECLATNGTTPGECSTGQVGHRCDTSDDCVESDCLDTGFGNRCGDGSVGSPCKVAGDCTSGYCALQSDSAGTNVVCTTGAAGEACDDDDDCQGFCENSGATGECSDGQLGEPCGENADCDSAYCGHFPDSRGECTDGSIGSFCVGDAQCATGICGDPATNSGECTDGSDGSPCGENADCNDSDCLGLVGNQPGLCTGGETGDPCETNDHCTEGFVCNLSEDVCAPE